MPHAMIANPIEHPPGEWFKVKKTGYKMECCSCSLVHDVSFRVDDQGEIELCVRRDDALTLECRAARGVKDGPSDWRGNGRTKK